MRGRNMTDEKYRYTKLKADYDNMVVQLSAKDRRIQNLQEKVRILDEELYYKDTNLIKKEARIKRMNDKHKSANNTPTPGN